MAGLADWLEDYRNWRGRQEWEQGKGWQDFFGGDPRAQEQFEKLSGFGTGSHGLTGLSGLAGSIKNIEEYVGHHRAPGPEFGAQLHDLTGGGTMYPDDIYSANAARFYGHGGQETARMDKKAVSLIHMLRNKPDELVEIYRAVPKDENITTINPGDWVTITPDYAKYHGEGPLEGDYKILKQKVPAKSIWTNADSIHEYGYWPDQ